MHYKIKGCKYCGETGHFEFACRKKPRKPLVAKKRMKKTGKHFDMWVKTRRKWLEQNKAPYYFCHYCGRMLTQGELTLDHYKARSRAPELRYVLKNLVPCCSTCNLQKGSLDGDEYIKKLREQMRGNANGGK